jgi:hypothetical protein
MLNLTRATIGLPHGKTINGADMWVWSWWVDFHIKHLESCEGIRREFHGNSSAISFSIISRAKALTFSVTNRAVPHDSEFRIRSSKPEQKLFIVVMSQRRFSNNITNIIPGRPTLPLLLNLHGTRSVFLQHNLGVQQIRIYLIPVIASNLYLAVTKNKTLDFLSDLAIFHVFHCN